MLEREKAQIAVLITMRPPTAPMRAEAAEAASYQSPWGNHQRLQIMTVAAPLDGARIDMPPLHQVDRTFKKAPRASSDSHQPLTLDFGETPDQPAG